MKKPLVLFAALCTLAVVSLTAYGAYFKARPTFNIYGADVLSTTASDGIIAQARHEVHEQFVDWKTDQNGKRSDPSFLESSQTWTTNEVEEKQSAFIGRGTTEFNDAQGHHIVIEVISGKDMPTLIFFSPKSGDGTAPLLNAFISSLQKQGVRMAGH